MQATQLATLADHVRNLPAQGAGRDRRLHRLTDVYAAAEAAEALQSVAARQTGIAATLLASASAVLERDDDAAFLRLREAVTQPEFLAIVPTWIGELREIASSRPGSGACTVGSALELWHWSMKHLRAGGPASALDELAEILVPLLAARAFAMDVNGRIGGPGEADLRTDLCHIYASRASATAGARCAEVVFGSRRHMVWDAEGCRTCYAGTDLDDLEAFIPGMASGARMTADVVEADGSHGTKAGPCATTSGVERFVRLRARLDGCLTGAAAARDRAAAALALSIESNTPVMAGGKA